MRFVNWGGARDGVPDRLSRHETAPKAARTTRGSTSLAGFSRANAARNAQTERDYHFDTGLADIAQASHALARPVSRLTARRQQPGNTRGAGLE